MIVVADTSPINYLIIMDQIDLLPRLYGQILIPHAVHDELLDLDAPQKVRLWAANPPHWLELLSPSAKAIEAIPELDLGETEAIALAEELRADWLLIDETAGRAVASQRGLKFVGTLGILFKAHGAGLVDLRTALQNLQATGFHVSQSLIETLLASL